MKKTLFTFLSACISAALFTSCAPKTGDVTFWQPAGGNYGITVVEVEGNTANITSDYTSAPDCGDPGCATFNLDYGTYSFTAADAETGAVWSGSFDIDGSCLTFELY